MASQTEENYLKALFHLSTDTDEVNISVLSSFLKVSKPTANSMIKNLQKKGMVKYQKYKPLVLTDEGKTAAALIVRKHRLTEMYLVEKMGFSWEQVHEIAEQVEHVKSEAFFERMDELLGNPNFDPHGSPIPDRNGEIDKENFKTLSECSQGSKVAIAALRHSSIDFLSFLDARGLSIGSELEIKSIESYDGSLTIECKGITSTISAEAGELLLVNSLDMTT